MRRQVTIHGAKLWLDASMAWLRIYKSAFNEDALLFLYDQLPLYVPILMGIDAEMDSIDQRFLLRSLWAMAKNADPDLVEPTVFYDQFEEIELSDMIQDFSELLFKSSVYNSDSHKSRKTDAEEKVKTVIVVAAGLRCGLQIQDTKVLTLAEWIEITDVFLPQGKESDDGVIIATQKHFDQFKRM